MTEQGAQGLFDLTGRVAVVTGSTRGIGRAILQGYSRAGASVVVSSRKQQNCDEVAAEIRATGGKAVGIACHVGDWDAIPGFVDAVVDEYGKIDVLVNNAGIIYREAIVDTSTDTFRSAIETDLVSQFMLAREVGRHMLARKYGRIVNISSIMGILGRASVAGYVAAKHGLIGLTKNLAAEYGPDVTCNAIAPGYIRTELNVPLQQNKAFNAMLEQRTAAHRWGKPEDLRGPLLLLASDAGAYMTGHTLVVDGGMTVILG